MDMAVSDNQAKNDMAVAKAQPKPAPKAKNEELEVLRRKYMLEEGIDSPKFKAIDRILRKK